MRLTAPCKHILQIFIFRTANLTCVRCLLIEFKFFCLPSLYKSLHFMILFADRILSKYFNLNIFFSMKCVRWYLHSWCWKSWSAIRRLLFDNINILKYIFKYLSLGTYVKMHSRMATRNLKCMNKSNVLITQRRQLWNFFACISLSNYGTHDILIIRTFTSMRL